MMIYCSTNRSQNQVLRKAYCDCMNVQIFLDSEGSLASASNPSYPLGTLAFVGRMLSDMLFGLDKLRCRVSSRATGLAEPRLSQTAVGAPRKQIYDAVSRIFVNSRSPC